MSQRVMLVEDCEGEALLLKQRLRAAGLAVPILHFQEPETAMAYLTGDGNWADRAKHPVPHFLLLDLGLPRIDGFQILRWIRSQPSLAPLIVIAVTADQDSHRIELAYQLGASSFLSKNGTDEEYGHFVDFFESYVRFTARIQDGHVSIASLPEAFQSEASLEGANSRLVAVG